MGLVSLWLRARRRCSGGIRAAWYREIVRSSILKSPPHPWTCDASCCEVHILTSADDWQNALWAIKSFYHASNASYALNVHDDGTLPEEGRRAIGRLFPDAAVISRSQSDRDVTPWLAPYPKCAAFRKSNKLALKVFDTMFYAQAPRIMLLDSDILFFRRPAEFLRRIENADYRVNSANADVASAYTVTPDEVRRSLGFTLIEKFNSGLCLLHRDSLRLDWLEDFLGLPDVLSHFWRIEQTLLALSSSKFGVELLPEDYSVRLDRNVTGLPCRHYVGAIRNLMYSEGIAELASADLLTKPAPLSAAKAAAR